jgi:hypothetical protein
MARAYVMDVMWNNELVLLKSNVHTVTLSLQPEVLGEPI